MTTRPHPSLAPAALTLAVALSAALPACAGTATAPPAVSASATATPSPAAAEVEEVAVALPDGRTLAASCSGDGSPVVLYLHGMIQQGDGPSWAHAPELRSRLEGGIRYCEYERANVGDSSEMAGPIPLETTVADLAAVVDAVSPVAPVVLIGGSFGGIVGYTFAGMHPERVAGMVLLDPTLPDEPGLERAFLDESLWLPPDAWQTTKERIDAYAAYAVAQRALATIPAVPGTIFVTSELWAPEGANAEPFRQGVRDQQAALIAHFTPAETVTVDAPHAMVSVVPDEIADAVRGIVARVG